MDLNTSPGPEGALKSQETIAMRFLNTSVLPRKSLNRNLFWDFPFVRPEKWGDSQLECFRWAHCASTRRIVGARCFQNGHFGRISSTLYFTMFQSSMGEKMGERGRNCFLRFPAVSCGFLRFSAAPNHLPCRSRTRSAKIFDKLPFLPFSLSHLAFYSVFYSVSELRRACFRARRVSLEPCFRQAHCFVQGPLLGPS